MVGEELTGGGRRWHGGTVDATAAGGDGGVVGTEVAGHSARGSGWWQIVLILLLLLCQCRWLSG